MTHKLSKQNQDAFTPGEVFFLLVFFVGLLVIIAIAIEFGLPTLIDRAASLI